MRLYRQKALLLVLISSIACQTTTAPGAVAAWFTLRAINGRPLPTYLSSTPGPTVTIISAHLTLNEAGKAFMTEDRRNFDGTEATYTSTLDYRINGNQIEIGCFGPTQATTLCLANFTGTIGGGGVSLIINPTSADGQIIYQYQSSLD
jgi:hypothetical protein